MNAPTDGKAGDEGSSRINGWRDKAKPFRSVDEQGNGNGELAIEVDVTMGIVVCIDVAVGSICKPERILRLPAHEGRAVKAMGEEGELADLPAVGKGPGIGNLFSVCFFVPKAE